MMTVSLSPETQKLFEERMRRGGYASPEDLVRVALEVLDQAEGEPLEALDAETLAAIERAEAQSARGEGRPWADVRAELRERFVKP
jgi:Arc/MetJ-type ribon-helix-helix transcriptional regulator